MVLFFIAVTRSNLSFEAIFSELGFLKHENLKRARLRLSISQPKHCHLNIRVMDEKSGQIYGDYVMLPQQSGPNSLILTKSLQKLAANFNQSDKRLKIRITPRMSSNGKNLCSSVVSGLTGDAYLVTNTDEINTRKRRSNVALPKMFRRTKRGVPKCTMNTINVNLTSSSSNNTIFIFPSQFKTGICGLHQPVPLGNDPMIHAIVQAIKTAMNSSPAFPSNSPCCTPSKFQKIPVLYIDSIGHTVLRYVDKVKVTGCACSNT